MTAPSIRFPRTWRTRYLHAPPGALSIELPYSQGMAVSAPWPQALQSAFPPNFAEQLPWVTGRYPMGAALPRYARALRAGISPDEIEENPGIDLGAPTPDKAAPIIAVANRGKHTNWAADVPAAPAEVVLLPGDEWGITLLIINDGPTEVRLGLDRSATVGDGIPLAPFDAATNTRGFVEIVTGTVSEVRATGNGGASRVVVMQGLSHPYPGGH